MKLIDESPNKPIITTHYVMSTGSTITYIRYDEDGDWQFFGNEDVEESDARIMSAKQILDLDKSLADLPDMEKGQSASRQTADSKWIISNE